MQRSLVSSACLSMLLFLSACQTNGSDATGAVTPTGAPTIDFQQVGSLSVATWNTEHLAENNLAGCRPRTAQELDAMRAYAASLDADIVALQEVDSAAAVAALFPRSEWQIVMSSRDDNEPFECRQNGNPSTQQKVAFAVKNGITITSVESLDAFSLDRVGLRHGLEIDVDTPLGEATLLNLHMKSSCFVDDYSKDESPACQTFARQASLLANQIRRYEQSDKPFIVLGDMNHRLSAPYNRLTRDIAQIAQDAKKHFSTPSFELIGCHPRYPAPIDHIIAGNFNGSATFNAQVHGYGGGGESNMLSDHCAVSVAIESPALKLSRSVRWTTESAEYRNITKRIYAHATNQLHQMDLSKGVIVMDVDETILDNSGYQAWLNRTGNEYKSKTWAAWVKAKEATLVPGVAEFIETAVKNGARLGFVTNRPRSLDSYTWDNLIAQGLPISSANTCLMGRTQADKDAMNGVDIVNDKDLRRQQIEQGIASCYVQDGERQSLYPALPLIMQVGDNAEDFSRVLQHDKDLDALLEKHVNDFILLPNAMYGSWL